MSFEYIDLFAGIGGFHAALSALGGTCVYSVEIDEAAADVYWRNWGQSALGDITLDVTEEHVRVPRHDVLVAGFPCQPFSKSGAQRGMDETRGTLYWNILRIIEEHHPSLVVLENVRNLAGPRHLHEWDLIIRTLREAGYFVSATPLVVSPHRIKKEFGGRPQVRERVFIVAVLSPNESVDLDVDVPTLNLGDVIRTEDDHEWNLEIDLPLATDESDLTKLSSSELDWIDAWDEFVRGMWERTNQRLPGFPLWGDSWVLPDQLKIPKGTPKWKADFIVKNARFYEDHQDFIDEWALRHDFFSDKFPASRRKLEWQAQDTKSLWETVMHLRPSGIRAKRATYLPALVAITQTSIIGPLRRRLSPVEAARLQGLPDTFWFDSKKPSATYKQLGNGVNVGAVWQVVRHAVTEYRDVFSALCPGLLAAVDESPDNPDEILSHHIPFISEKA